MLLWNERNSGKGKKREELTVLYNNFVPEFVTGIAVVYQLNRKVSA